MSKPSAAGGEKLQKVLARAGLGSRRVLEGWIEAGRVSVNGKRARLGDRVSACDAVRVDGRPLESWRMRPAPARVLRYHKPAGEVTTRSDPQGRPTVFERLPGLRSGRWVAVGRLDVNTSGLLLFTTDGALAHALMHPSHGVPREYAVRLYGEAGPEAIARALAGVELEDGIGRFEAVEEAGGEGRNRWYRVRVSEGRNRLVRRVWNALGLEVSRLVRLRYGPVELPRRLRPGRFEQLDDASRDALYAAADLPAPPGPVTGDGAQAGPQRGRGARRRKARTRAKPSSSRTPRRTSGGRSAT